MKRFARFLYISGVTALFLGTASAESAKAIRLEHTASPNGSIVIVALGSAKTPAGLCFVDSKTDQRLGWIIPPEEAGASIKDIKASWNRDGSKVALQILAGTKSDGVAIYRRGSDNNFMKVPFEAPDPIKLFVDAGRFDRSTMKAADARENELGGWSERDVLHLLAGQTVVMRNGDLAHLFIALRVTVRDSATIAVEELFGPYPEASSVFKEWKRHP